MREFWWTATKPLYLALAAIGGTLFTLALLGGLVLVEIVFYQQPVPADWQAALPGIVFSVAIAFVLASPLVSAFALKCWRGVDQPENDRRDRWYY